MKISVHIRINTRYSNSLIGYGILKCRLIIYFFGVLVIEKYKTTLQMTKTNWFYRVENILYRYDLILTSRHSQLQVTHLQAVIIHIKESLIWNITVKKVRT